jgi:acylphosphatase
MNVAQHVVVKGRVQGVGYRAWTERQALQRGLAGWVRNRRDDSVEAMFSGPADVVAAMIQALHRGPPASAVETVDQRDATADEVAMIRPGDRFSVLPTA